ncbi:MAG: sulfite exporter TauE/SafE family protein [Lachnospiraceae bacterium]|nr:sulfite exporter TauE/SafE family protein [Lachnospiraceae bacterium]
MKEILFILIQVIANTIQTITGFAGGPIAMPPSMALVGVGNAKAAITMILWLVTIIVTVQNLKYINPKKLGIMLFFMILGMIPGIWLFDRLPTKILMIVYGLIVVAIGVDKLLRKNSKDLKTPYSYIALLMSGVMQGMFTSGGPFLALYATTAMKDKREFRATVSSIWAVLNIYLMWNMFRQGMYTGYVMKLAGMSILPVFAAIWIGNKISHKIKQETFLKLVYVLLIVSGGILLLNAFM